MWSTAVSSCRAKEVDLNIVWSSREKREESKRHNKREERRLAAAGWKPAIVKEKNRKRHCSLHSLPREETVLAYPRQVGGGRKWEPFKRGKGHSRVFPLIKKRKNERKRGPTSFSADDDGKLYAAHKGEG